MTDCNPFVSSYPAHRLEKFAIYVHQIAQFGAIGRIPDEEEW
jgi:hypothetical protein